MNFIFKSIFLLCILFASFDVSAQIDSVGVGEEQKSVVKIEHSPRKAAMYSAVLPGLGQIYNKKYYKAPLVYIGFATFGYFIKWQNDHYKQFKQGYYDFVDSNPETDAYLKIRGTEVWDLSSTQLVQQYTKQLKDGTAFYHRNRDYLVILTTAFYLLNVLDANVDAHFIDFSIDENLSMNFSPVSINPLTNTMVLGATVTFTF